MKKIILTIVICISILARIYSITLELNSDISSNTTIVLSKYTYAYISANIHIKNNSTVTIIGRNTNLWIAVGFSCTNVGYSIIIEKGSTLILDGAKIGVPSSCANACWGGIKVKGNDNADQRLLYPHNQGYLIFENGAIIDNADTGIYVEGGGIVRGSNQATIQNCHKGVIFEHYQNPVSSKSNSNLSYFDHCKFLITGQQNYGRNCGFEYFVCLNDVQGVSFFGDTFKININSYKYTGIGIYSNNSSFTVQRAEDPNRAQVCLTPNSCIPAPTGGKNVFTNLREAIYIGNNITGRKVSINENVFNDNSISIYCQNDNNTLIYGNEFNYVNNIPNDPGLAINGIYSILTYHSKYLRVLQNNFNWNFTTSVTKDFYGIYITNPDYTSFSSPSSLNLCKVKKNTFTNNSPANKSHLFGSYIEPKGLTKTQVANYKYVCNTFTNLNNAIFISDYGSKGIVSQYDPDIPSTAPYYTEAGNTFTYMTNTKVFVSFGDHLNKINYFSTLVATKQPYPSCYYNVPTISIINNISTNVISNTCLAISSCDIYGRVANTVTLTQGSNKVVYTPHLGVIGVQIEDTIIIDDSTIVVDVFSNDTVFIDVIAIEEVVEVIEPTIDSIEIDSMPPKQFVHVYLSPNPSFSDITLSLSSAIIWFDNYTVSIYDETQNQVYTHTYSAEDSTITIPRSLIGYAGIYHCIVSFNNEIDTNISFQIIDSISVTINPNPAFSQINISLEGIEYYPNYTLKIYDEENSLVYEQMYNTTVTTVQVPRSSIGNNGNYTCNILVGNTTIIRYFSLFTPKVHVNLAPNPSNSDISLSLSNEIAYYDNYTIDIFDENQYQRYSNNYSDEDTFIVISRSSIGYNGTYNCRVTINNEVDTNINFNLTDTIEVTIYPNPTIGDINISLTGIDNYQYYTVNIYDQTNTLIYQHQYSTSENPIYISGSSIGSSGTYTCAIVVNNQIVYATFVIIISD